jgi:WASH complex subunit 7
MDAIKGASLLSVEDTTVAFELIELAEVLCTYKKSIENHCDTSFLFIARELFPVCLSGIFSNADESGRLPLLVSAFRCCEKLLARGGANASEIVELENYIEACVEREIIQPLCRDIETDLRLHLHSARIVGVANANPFKDGVCDLSSFTNLPPIRMLNYQVRN